MNFVFLDDIDDTVKVDLQVLKRDSQRNSILLYQHEGTLVANNARIGNADDVTVKLRAFFILAKERNVDLALTPEYSCPINIVEEIISDPQKWPGHSKLWALGCESVTKAQLAAFREKFNSPSIKLHFEEALLEHQNNYFDPLIYLFTSMTGNVTSLVVIIQFKTMHMGVWSGGIVERNNLICGNSIYILRNSPDSIRFMTLICSEAMNFEDNLQPQVRQTLMWTDLPYLVFNPQLNPAPTNSRFTDFRKFIFQSNNKEIISLNWNNRSTIGNGKMITDGSSRSGIYIKSDEINTKDYARIKKNHALGLYYFNMAIHKHAFTCNSTIHAFIIVTPPVSIINALPVQSRRDGPEAVAIFSFDDAGVLTEQTDADDEHIAFLGSLGCANPFMQGPDNCIIEKERLVCISSGELAQGADPAWYLLDNLRSVRLDDTTEIYKRITVPEDISQESLAQKRIYIRAINELNNILARKEIYPDSIAILKDIDVVLGYSQKIQPDGKKKVFLDKYKYNLTTIDNEAITATVCFLDHPMPWEVNEKFDLLQSFFEYNDNGRGTVVIFYRINNDIFVRSDQTAGKISNTDNYHGPSILKD